MIPETQLPHFGRYVELLENLGVCLLSVSARAAERGWAAPCPKAARGVCLYVCRESDEALSVHCALYKKQTSHSQKKNAKNEKVKKRCNCSHTVV